MKTIVKVAVIALAVTSFCACNKLESGFQNRDKVVSPEYKEAFIQTYGQISPKQNWDKTYPMPVEGPETGIEILKDPQTKAISGMAELAQPGEAGYYSQEFIQAPLSILGLKPTKTLGEISYIRDVYPTLEPKDWAPNTFGVHDMWHWYTHSSAEEGENFGLGLAWFDPLRGYPKIKDPETGEFVEYTEDGPCGTQNYHSLPILSFPSRPNSWFGTSAYAGSGGGYRFGTDHFEGMEDVFWYANFLYDEYGMNDFRPIEKYIEIVTPSGAIYWGFDVNFDGDCSDLICLIEPSQQQIKRVRYMMEDLGSIGDFDFNDIVVDVIQTRSYTTAKDSDGIVQPVYGEWKQYAVVRALGGSIDFTITIGNTSWKKSDHFEAGKIINTGSDANYDAQLAVFDVTGWDYENHNVSVSLIKGVNQGVQTITFPKAGEVPIMLAVDTDVKWMVEGHNIPADWFTVPEE